MFALFFVLLLCRAKETVDESRCVRACTLAVDLGQRSVLSLFTSFPLIDTLRHLSFSRPLLLSLSHSLSLSPHSTSSPLLDLLPLSLSLSTVNCLCYTLRVTASPPSPFHPSPQCTRQLLILLAILAPKSFLLLSFLLGAF